MNTSKLMLIVLCVLSVQSVAIANTSESKLVKKQSKEAEALKSLDEYLEKRSAQYLMAGVSLTALAVAGIVRLPSDTPRRSMVKTLVVAGCSFGAVFCNGVSVATSKTIRYLNKIIYS